MIEIERFSFRYADGPRPTLRDVDIHVPEGDLALVAGSTGSGKSTLLQSLNGLVPHFTGGHVEGRVICAGLDPRHSPPREFVSKVGVVGQDPLAGFVADTVEDELAFSMEQLATAPAVMRRRVEETLDALGIAGLRNRALRTLSGGEQQRVAIGAALTATPRVLVLDEPTSALDPGAAEDVLATLVRLVDDVGLTIVVAEHRLERIIGYADRLVVVADETATAGPVSDQLQRLPWRPPIVELARLAGWSPAPLSVRAARRLAPGLSAELARRGRPVVRPARPAPGDPADGLVADGLSVVYGGVPAVRDVELCVAPGEVVGLMGRNGSGKSSLLWALQGAGRRDNGRVRAGGVEVAGRQQARRREAQSRSARPAGAHVALVPQSANDLLYHASIGAECRTVDAALDLPAGATWQSWARLAGVDAGAGNAPDPGTHPRDLSEGQRLALALAVQLATEPAVVLLDEPTRGLDYAAKTRLGETLASHAAAGRAVLVASHDVEFVAQVADRVIVLADGEVISDGPAGDVLTSSPVFAPQVARILAPQRWLTVQQVAEALHTGAEVPT